MIVYAYHRGDYIYFYSLYILSQYIIVYKSYGYHYYITIVLYLLYTTLFLVFGDEEELFPARKIPWVYLSIFAPNAQGE